MPANDRPRSNGDRESRPRRDGERPSYGDRGSSPRRGSDARGASSRSQRPAWDNERPSRPARDGERRDARPQRDADRPSYSRDSRPQRDGERRDSRPQRDADRPSYSRDSRPQRDGERRDFRPQRDGDRPSYIRDARPGRSDRDGDRGGRGTTRGGRDRDTRIERQYNNPPPPPRERVSAPEIPEDITASMLDKTARARLRTLSKDNAEDVGRHLVMAGQLLDTDPELAYRYAQVALARGGRVDIVREAAAVTAYATGRYDEALREFRTVRRLNGSSEHLALMADCERGLGRPARALALAAEPEAASLDRYSAAELQIVVAGARADLGDLEAALVTLEVIKPASEEQRVRIESSRADVLEAMGRTDEAQALRASLPETTADEDFEEFDDDVVVYDVAEPELDEDTQTQETQGGTEPQGESEEGPA